MTFGFNFAAVTFYVRAVAIEESGSIGSLASANGCGRKYVQSSLYETLKMLLVLFPYGRISPFYQVLKSWQAMVLQEVLSGSWLKFGSSLKENALLIKLCLWSQRFQSLSD